LKSIDNILEEKRHRRCSSTQKWGGCLEEQSEMGLNLKAQICNVSSTTMNSL